MRCFGRRITVEKKMRQNKNISKQVSSLPALVFGPSNPSSLRLCSLINAVSAQSTRTWAWNKDGSPFLALSLRQSIIICFVIRFVYKWNILYGFARCPFENCGLNIFFLNLKLFFGCFAFSSSFVARSERGREMINYVSVSEVYWCSWKYFVLFWRKGVAC